jgi:signal transduction histidine kinase
VSARFIVNGESPALPPAAALEVVRIVQEALVNVRKHSGAENVIVRLTRQNGLCTLTVEDDGRGFDFQGVLDSAELLARRIGPAIIKERARILGAELNVRSTPGEGAAIELTLQEPVRV